MHTYTRATCTLTPEQHAHLHNVHQESYDVDPEDEGVLDDRSNVPLAPEVGGFNRVRLEHYTTRGTFADTQYFKWPFRWSDLTVCAILCERKSNRKASVSHSAMCVCACVCVH